LVFNETQIYIFYYSILNIKNPMKLLSLLLVDPISNVR